MDRFEEPNKRNSRLTFPRFPEDFRANPSNGIDPPFSVVGFRVGTGETPENRTNDAPGTHNEGTRTGGTRATRRRRTENRRQLHRRTNTCRLTGRGARNARETARLRRRLDGHCHWFCDYGRVSRRTSTEPDRVRYEQQYAQRCRFAFGVGNFEAKTINLFVFTKRQTPHELHKSKTFMSFMLFFSHHFFFYTTNLQIINKTSIRPRVYLLF